MSILTRGASASQAVSDSTYLSNANLRRLHEAIGHPLPLPAWHTGGRNPLRLPIGGRGQR